MQKRRITLTLVAFTSLAVPTMSGCGLGINLNGVTADTTLAEIFGQITVGDVVNAFQSFSNDFASGSRFDAVSGETLAALEELQLRLDNGDLSQDGFAEEVRSLIGDAMPNTAFAGSRFYGGPFGSSPRTQIAELLDLTVDQQAEAQTIFESLHASIAELRSQAHDDMRAVLTQDQLNTLDEQMMMFSGFGGRSFNPGGRGLFHFGHGGGFINRFTELLQLSDDQTNEITAIRDAMKDEIRTLHQTARDEFMALLTPTQLDLLDALEIPDRLHDVDDASDEPMEADATIEAEDESASSTASGRDK
jgi:hypothetical protein